MNTGFEITKDQLKAYKSASVRDYRRDKSRKAFERVYGRLKQWITLRSPLLAVGITGLTAQIYV